MANCVINVSKAEVRGVIRFLVLENCSATEIFHRISNVYNGEVMSRAQVFRWAAKFKKGAESILDVRPNGNIHNCVVTDELIKRADKLVTQDRRVTVREIALKLDVSTGTAHRILTDHLGLRKKCSQWCPKVLTVDQKQNRKRCAQQLIERYAREGDTFLNKIVTGDETWCYHFDPETKRQSAQWLKVGAPSPRKARFQKSSLKVLASIFFDRKGIVDCSFMEKGRTINAEAYCETLGTLRRRIRRKRPGLLSEGVVFLHDNARPHTASSTVELLQSFKWEVLEHPPYSPDLSPCDFHLFGQLKLALKGVRFNSDTKIKEAIKKWLKEQDSAFFQKGIYGLVRQWRLCVEHDGDYF